MVFLRRLARLAVVSGCLSLTAATLSPGMAEDAYPTRPIRVFIPYPAGGIVDVTARILTNEVSKILGQALVIENKAGANTNLATGLAARAAPDGYTWVYLGSPTLVNPQLYKNLQWKTGDFVGVGIMAWSPVVIAVSPTSPANSLKDLVELARKESGKLKLASFGVSSVQHLDAAKLMDIAKVTFATVSYRGQPEAIMDVMADRVDAMFASVGLVSELVKAKKLKALAVISRARVPSLPDTPTVTEEGFEPINIVPWYGLAVQAGTPPAIVRKINAAINTALEKPEVRSLLEKQSLEPASPLSLEEIAALAKKDGDALRRIIEDARITIGNE